MADEESSLPVVAVTAAVGAVVLLLALLCSIGRSDKKSDGEEKQEKEDTKTEKSTEKTTKKSKLVQKSKKTAFVPFTHKWLACTLKGHSSRVVSLDFSPNGKYLVSASDDRVMMLWSAKEFNQKEHKFIRMNVELDTVTNIKFSPDSRALVGSLANSNTVRVFKLGKKEDSGNVGVLGTMDFPKAAPAEIRNMGVSSKGTFIMAGMTGTQLAIYDLKGEQLELINTHQMSNNYSCVSPCGRFVASSGFSPDVKIWEVVGAGSDVKVVRAMELKGHNSGIYCVSFNGDSSRVATVSKDGTWKLWDTDVRYSQGQDAKLLFSGPVSLEGASLIALSPDGRTVAICSQANVVFWDAVSCEEMYTLQSLHAEPITALAFDNSNHYLVTCGDKHIQVIHNVPGYKTTIADLLQREKKATSTGMRDRIRQQIKEARDTLAAIEGESNGDASGAK